MKSTTPSHKPTNHETPFANSGVYRTWIYSPVHWTMLQSFENLRHLYLILETLYFVTDESLHAKIKEQFSRFHTGFLPLSNLEWNLLFSTFRDPALLPKLIDTLVSETTLREMERTLKHLIWDALRPLSLRDELVWQSASEEVRKLANQFPIPSVFSLHHPPLHSAESGEGVTFTSPYMMRILSRSVDLPLSVNLAWEPEERAQGSGPYPLKQCTSNSVDILLPHCPHQNHELSSALQNIGCILQIHWAWGRIQNFVKGLCIEHRIPEKASVAHPCEVKLFVPKTH